MRVFRYKIIIKIIKHFSSELIIQQRDFDNKLSFFKDWNSYKSGFGSGDGYWRGLQEIHELTKTGLFSLNVSLEAKDGQEVYAFYESFNVEDEASLYTMNVNGFSGTVGSDVLIDCNGRKFITFDKDKDNYGAVRHKSGWWYCGSNLNGIMKERTDGDFDHVYCFEHITGIYLEPLYKTRMTLILKTTP